MRNGVGYRESTSFSNPSTNVSNSGGGNGVCMMSSSWRNEQHPSFIDFISSFLDANSFRLNIVPIGPVTTLLGGSSVLAWILCLHLSFLQDFIFNCGGVSVAFVFETNWDSSNSISVFKRVQRLKEQFAHLYVVVTIPTKEQNDSLNRSYFECGVELGRPVFMPVQDLEMGFEKIVKISHARGVCKRQDAISKLKVERERSLQTMDVYLKVLTSIPGIDSHDANALNQAIGSIEAIAKASKEYILENTDLSADKAETVTRFFKDPGYYLSPKIS